METKFIEASNEKVGGINWGKFLVARFTEEEWAKHSAVDGRPLLRARGWDAKHILVMDIQTGEGCMLRHGGLASADLDKHCVWVCPMFQPFLDWLYKQDVNELISLPAHINIPDPKSSMSGYRRKGPDFYSAFLHNLAEQRSERDLALLRQIDEWAKQYDKDNKGSLKNYG